MPVDDIDLLNPERFIADLERQQPSPVDHLRSSLINGIKRMPVAFTPERQRNVAGG